MNPGGIIKLGYIWMADGNSQGSYYIKDYFE